jgi:low temperature requirement protein LtrA
VAGARASSPLHVFKSWFWRPPRPHGQTILDRHVSPLELLYDLVYAAVIAQAGNRLAGHLSPAGLIECTLVFSLTWFAWVSGSLYLELHGRDDGRTRAFVFLQIGILTIVAVFAGDASGASGSAFAMAYSAYLIVMTWLWYEVRRQDIREHRTEFLLDTGRYVMAMAASVVLILASAFVPTAFRFGIWAIFSAGWIVIQLLFGRARVGLGRGMTPTDSLVDRFGTFTLIVLGEVVFGVVDGLSHSRHDPETIATGMIALIVGFGFWWIYFDVVGGRLPKPDGRALASWTLSHYPLTLSIAAAGAGMVSIIESAHDARTPASSSWLLAGAVATGLLFLIPASRALADAALHPETFRTIWIAMAMGALASLLIGWASPAPWLLALMLVVVLGLVWAAAVRGFALAGVWAADGGGSQRVI